jgi:hypothetical protein
LASIIPAPVASRSSFTIAAVIDISVSFAILVVPAASSPLGVTVP